MRCSRCDTLNPDGTLMCVRCKAYLVAAPKPRPSGPLNTQNLSQGVTGIHPQVRPDEARVAAATPSSQPPPPPPVTQASPSATRPLLEIDLKRLPTGPLRELFERGGVLDDKFALTRELGRGGMGFVFAGQDLSLGREVAVKILPPHYSDDELVVRRFHREARAMASLDHANIVTVYSIGQSAGLHYFVMKRLTGETLAHEMKRRELGQKPRFTAREVVSMISQVCSGLHHAHQKGILHRDIKPGNLMLSPDGRVTIMDFGIVKLLNTSETGGMQTAHGKIFGTPEYMPPEQAMGKGEYSPASDIYALGVVAYELLCGVIPFKGATPIEIILQHIRTPPPPLVGPFAGQLPTLELALSRALAKEMGARFADALDFASALERALPQYVAVSPPAPPAPSPTTLELDELAHEQPDSLDFQGLELQGGTDELAEEIQLSDLQELDDADGLDEMERALLSAVDDEPMTREVSEPPQVKPVMSTAPVVSTTPVVSTLPPPPPSSPFTQELTSLGAVELTPPPQQRSVSAPQPSFEPQAAQPRPQPEPTSEEAGEALTRAIPRVEVEAASSRKGHYKGLPFRRKGT